MRAWRLTALLMGLFGAVTRPASAQVCTGVAYYEACLDAIGGRPMGSMMPRDPSRIIDGIFRTEDTPPRFAPSLTFGQLMTDLSAINSPSCSGGVSSSSVPGFPAANPRQYTAYQCVENVPREQVGTYANALDWRWVQNYRVRSDGMNATDGDNCGGNRAACGYESPWAGGMIFDLRGSANRVVIFPITDHVSDSCLEAFEYSVYLTDNPRSREFVATGSSPDPNKWNAAQLVRAYLRGWTDNANSTGTMADIAAHPLETGRGTSDEAIADSIATVWALPCGVTFRYAAIVPGNYGNPDGRCAFHSNEDEFDAVAGLNEDGTALCPDADNDGFRDARCGGNDCNDADPMVNPGAAEDCRSTRDVNCDGRTPSCPTGTACVEGLCVSRCVEGACAEGFRCVMQMERDYCVPSACAGMSCPPGQICGPMGCQAPCDGARCPSGQTCVGGACVDACAGVTCPSMQRCVAGRCQPSCSCTGCPSGQTCNRTSGSCLMMGCADLPCAEELRDCSGSTPRCRTSFCDGVRCPLGQVCNASARRCEVDLCSGIACPGGTTCVDGTCVRPPMDASMVPDASESDGAGLDVQVSDTAVFDGGNRDAAADTRRRIDGGTGDGSANCACRTTGRVGTVSSKWRLLLLLGLISSRRRRGRT